MRGSSPIPIQTWPTSAPTTSHNAATAFTKLTFAARNALEAYLMVSAVDGLVKITGASNPANNPETRTALSSSGAPITIRLGCRKSCTAEPSRRNSGLETMRTSLRPSIFPTVSAEPTGTVDLSTTIDSLLRCGPISVATALTKLMSDPPSRPSGVGRQRKMNSASSTAQVLSAPNARWPEARPVRMRSSRPSSKIGILPELSSSTRAVSRSLQRTS